MQQPATATDSLNSLKHPADRLLHAIHAIGSPICVGLDPVIDKMPEVLRAGSDASAIASFGVKIVHALKGIAPCVKIQSACYERFGPDGMSALAQTMQAARENGIVTILDGKRGDIGISAEHYSVALFDKYQADWTTVSPYLGMETITPFTARGGAFALVRTSNPGSDALQTLRTADGPTVAESIAAMVSVAGSDSIGTGGYSALGAVVGATKAREVASLRALMPQQLFLVPGFGAQGGTIDDVLACFNSDGRGAVITASRSVIYPPASTGSDWLSSIQRAAESFANEIRCGVARAGGSN